MINDLNFKASQSLPPSNVEAEESVIGCLLFDSEAIYRIAETLAVEAFYIEPHKTIYKAILALYKKQQKVDLIAVADYLSDKDKLAAVGGKIRLLQLVDRTITAVNIDALADVLIRKHIRRQLIQLGHTISYSAYESDIEVKDLLAEVEEKTLALTQSPLRDHKQDLEEWKYNNLIKAVRHIELNVDNPGLRAYKLNNLAKKFDLSPKCLEAIYFKSLLADQNEAPLSLAEFKQAYGKDLREWFMGGLLPVGKTILLHSAGGIGKTALTYDLGLSLAKGQNWSGFPTNKKCKLLYVQTDEPQAQTISTLEILGYDDSIQVHLKSRWTMEHCESLLKDIKKYEVDFVVIDSLSSTNAHSTFSENDVEYSRPLLKLKDIAAQTGCTIIILHHDNRNDEFRGGSAIFASVSEVWQIQRDLSHSTDGFDRLLKIEKSRSRLLGTYRLRFDPEDKTYSCLGKLEEDANGATATTKDKIVDFLDRHRGIAYEAEEFFFEVGGTLDHVRRCLATLALDGVIYKKHLVATKGKPQRYFLPSNNKHTRTFDSEFSQKNADHPPQNADHSVCPEFCADKSSVSSYSDHGINGGGSEFCPTTTGISGYSDHHPPKNLQKNFSELEQKNGGGGSALAETLVNVENNSDHHSDHPPEKSPNDQHSLNTCLQTASIPVENSPPPHTEALSGKTTKPCSTGNGFRTPSPFTVEIECPQLGKSKATITPLKVFKSKEMQIQVEYKFADGTKKEEKHKIKGNKKEAEAIATTELTQWQDSELVNPSRRYTVQQIGGTEFQPKVALVKNCICTKVPSHPNNSFYIFVTKDDEIIRVAGDNEFWTEK